jgi:hypothetical protein
MHLNINVKLTLSMPAYRGIELYASPFLTSALGGFELSASGPGRSTSGRRTLLPFPLYRKLSLFVYLFIYLFIHLCVHLFSYIHPSILYLTEVSVAHILYCQMVV